MKKLLFLLSLVLICNFSYSQTIPKSKGYVSDYENIFTPKQNADLTKILEDYENETTIEIAILTVSDFESDIADFAQKTATEWGIGKKGVNNGLLIIISKNKKILRSQTGYGLEGYIPDGWLKHTGDSIAIKYFSMNNYYDGATIFVNQIKERIGKEGYSEEHNKELVEKNKESNEPDILDWMIENIPWYYWVGLIVGWIILFFIWPEGALWIIYILLSSGKSGSGGGGKGFGGGSFGGGGSSSSWK